MFQLSLKQFFQFLLRVIIINRLMLKVLFFTGMPGTIRLYLSGGTITEVCYIYQHLFPAVNVSCVKTSFS